MRKRILIINENVDEAEKIKERLVSAYNDVEYRARGTQKKADTEKAGLQA